MEMILKNVNKSYHGIEILKDISLNLKSGGVYGLVGPNGAGKTTLIKLLTTLEAPTSGTIHLDGVNIVKKPKQIREQLGYLPQNVQVYPELTCVEYLTYFGMIKGIDKKQLAPHVNHLISLFNLEAAKDKKLGTYSGGMKQRVGLANALLGNPKIIILDEPSVGLDPEERINLRVLFETLAMTRILILSTHIMSDIELTAQNIIVMKKGEIKYADSKEKFVEMGDIEQVYLNIIGKNNLVSESTQ